MSVQVFDYEAISDDGKPVSGTLRSSDVYEALQQLRALGHHPKRVTPLQTGWRGGAGVLLRPFRRVSVGQLAVTTRQLATILKAGVSLRPALAMVRDQCSHRYLREILDQTGQRIARDGVGLYESLADHPQVFNTLYQGMVRAGEEGGRLVEVLKQLADYLANAAPSAPPSYWGFCISRFFAAGRLLGCIRPGHFRDSTLPSAL